MGVAVGVIGEGAITIVGHRAQRPGGVHRRGVRVVGVDVSVLCAEGHARTIFIGSAADGKRNRRVVLAGDGDRCGLGAAQPVVVGDRVAEGIGRGLAGRQVLGQAVGVIGAGAIAVVGHRAQLLGGVDRGGVRVVGVVVAVLCAEGHARTIFIGSAADGKRNRRVVLAGDGDRRGLGAAQPVVVGDGVAERIGDRKGVV